MRRRLFNLLAALSLVLCVATVVLWVRSRRIVDTFVFAQPERAIFMQSGGGQFRFEHTHALYTLDDSRYSGFSHRVNVSDGRPLRTGMMTPGSRVYLDRWGFWIVTGERWGDDHHAFFAPAWFVASLFATFPIVWSLDFLKRRSVVPGHCPTCGYDLRATPGRCPECGERVSDAAA